MNFPIDIEMRRYITQKIIITVRTEFTITHIL